MKLIFETSYLAWFVPLCLIGGIGLALLLYYNSSFTKNKGFFSYPVILLTVLRFFTISLLLFFLLSPLLKKISEHIEKPIILIAIDNSKSIILNRDSGYYKNEFPSQLNKYSKEISDRFDVQTVVFGDKVTENVSPDFGDNRTNISNLISYIDEQYYNRNLGAVIIASDGIYNEGRDPLTLTEKIKTPVYTVAMGDTTIYKDLMIKELITNSIAYAGNSFPIRIRIQAGKCANTRAQLTVKHDDKIIASENFIVNNNYFDKSFDVSATATNAGLQRYIVSVSRIPGEINYRNNSRQVFVDVLENKKSVLLIAASPHPDISAIKNSLTIHENYKTKTIMANELPRNRTELEKLVAAFDVVLIHQLPSKNNPAKDLFAAIDARKIPLFIILGNQTSVSQFNALETGLKINQKKEMTNLVLPLLDNSFNYFNIPDKAAEIVPELPPLYVPFGDYRISQEAQILMKQKIGQITSDMPLLLFISGINTRIAVLCGEGIWKWPLIEYKLRGNQLIFDDLINKSIQYLSVKADKRFFRFRSLRTQFYEDEHVGFNAEVLNQSYEMLKGAKVKMIVTDDQNKKKEFRFQETDDEYSLDLGYLPQGNYKYLATTYINGTEQKLSGEFSVNTIDVEFLNTIADHKLLFKIAKTHDGKMFYPNLLNDLVKEVNNNKNIKPMTFFESKIRELIEIKWLFFLIVILLSTEWFFRKFYGSY